MRILYSVLEREKLMLCIQKEKKKSREVTKKKKKKKERNFVQINFKTYKIAIVVTCRSNLSIRFGKGKNKQNCKLNITINPVFTFL